MSSMKQWMEPGMRTPFCSVRRYSRLCYALCRGHIALPRLQFTTFDGPDFTFDGKHLSVTSMTSMYHSVYREMTRILDRDLLFGAGDAVLQHLKNPEDVVDHPHKHVIGRGVLVSEMQAAWNPVKFMMDDEKLCKKYFSIDSSGNPLPRKGAWEEYLWQVEEFKEHLYFLLHQIPGMPKRGSEEIRAKIVDTSFRGRNIMYLFHRLACIGDYSKSSRNSGNDKLTLHFFARPLEAVLRRFQASVASISAWAIDRVLAPEDVDPHHHCYLLSSMGQRWTSERLSRILQKLTAKHLPGKISLNMSSLRHILPGIAEHYQISNILSPRNDDVLHAQLGHSQETGDRMYARAHQDHPQLTNSMAHRTMSFCDLWQELLGFGGDVPDEKAALSLQASYVQQRSSSRKTLSVLWKTPPAVTISDPLSLDGYHNLEDRLCSMERSLAKLNYTISSIAQALLPSIAAPPEVLPRLRQPLKEQDQAEERPLKRTRVIASAGDLDDLDSQEDIAGLTFHPDKGLSEERPLKRMKIAASTGAMGGSGDQEDVSSLAFQDDGKPANSKVSYTLLHILYRSTDINLCMSLFTRRAKPTSVEYTAQSVMSTSLDPILSDALIS